MNQAQADQGDDEMPKARKGSTKRRNARFNLRRLRETPARDDLPPF
jgi:hypothetical protein